MDLKTQDIIKILPFDEGFKTGLLERYDSLDADQRYRIEKLMWDLYDAIYTLKIQQKVAESLDPDSPDDVKLDKNFYKRVRDQVDHEMTQDSTKVVEAIDLQSARTQLQEIMNQKSE